MIIELLDDRDKALSVHPIEIDLPHPFEPGKTFSDIRKVETSILIFWMNYTVADSMIQPIVKMVLQQVPFEFDRSREIGHRCAIQVLRQIAAELDKRLPQTWG